VVETGEGMSFYLVFIFYFGRGGIRWARGDRTESTAPP